MNEVWIHNRTGREWKLVGKTFSAGIKNPVKLVAIDNNQETIQPEENLNKFWTKTNKKTEQVDKMKNESYWEQRARIVNRTEDQITELARRKNNANWMQEQEIDEKIEKLYAKLEIWGVKND